MCLQSLRFLCLFFLPSCFFSVPSLLFSPLLFLQNLYKQSKTELGFIPTYTISSFWLLGMHHLPQQVSSQASISIVDDQSFNYHLLKLSKGFIFLFSDHANPFHNYNLDGISYYIYNQLVATQVLYEAFVSLYDAGADMKLFCYS